MTVSSYLYVHNYTVFDYMKKNGHNVLVNPKCVCVVVGPGISIVLAKGLHWRLSGIWLFLCVEKATRLMKSQCIVRMKEKAPFLVKERNKKCKAIFL